MVRKIKKPFVEKSIYLILAIQILLAACSNEAFVVDGLEPYQCDPVDAVDYPEPWTKEVAEAFVIPDETIKSMSTCGLLETILEYPPNKMLGPWCVFCSDLHYPGVASFNNSVRADKVAVELFERNDCFPVMASRYLTIIEEKKEHSGQIAYCEMLLASDLCMSALTEKEKVQLMAMALEKARHKSKSIHEKETYHIMAAIMQSCNYIPFMKEIDGKLGDFLFGYGIEDANGFHDLERFNTVKHAKQFLNEYK